MVESALWQTAKAVGPEGMGRITEARDEGCSAAAGKDRYKMVSRLLHEGDLHLHKRQALFRQERMDRKGSLPITNMYF